MTQWLTNPASQAQAFDAERFKERLNPLNLRTLCGRHFVMSRFNDFS
jgi:hypothetical protein